MLDNSFHDRIDVDFARTS